MKQFLLTILFAVLFSLAALAQAPTTRVIVPLEGGTQSINIAPDTYPTAQTDQSWIGMSLASHSINNGSQSVVVLMVTVAPSSTPRSGVIKLTSNSGTTTIPVLQTTTATTVSAASYSAGKLVANSLASIFGTGFASQILAPQSLPLPITLGGVSVKIINTQTQEEASCKLLFISPTQINIHIPDHLQPGTYTILTTNADGSHASGTIALTDTAPDIFTVNQKGTGNPALLLQVNGANGSVSYQQPRTITNGTDTWTDPINLNVQGNGYILLFATGLGSNVNLAASYIRINQVSYPLVYAGPQGQFAGLDQVAFAAPTLPSGNHTAQLVINGKAANPVVIPVQ